MQSTCNLAWGVALDRKRDRSVVLSWCLCIFDTSGSVRGCMCVYTHTHTQSAHWVLDVSRGVGTRYLKSPKSEPRGRNETLGGPEKSRWTKSQQTCIRTCVQSTHVCIYAVRQEEFWNNCFFPWTYFFFRKSKAKDVIVKYRYLKQIEFPAKLINYFLWSNQSNINQIAD